jgi:hypothetical protein
MRRRFTDQDIAWLQRGVELEEQICHEGIVINGLIHAQQRHQPIEAAIR